MKVLEMIKFLQDCNPEGNVFLDFPVPIEGEDYGALTVYKHIMYYVPKKYKRIGGRDYDFSMGIKEINSHWGDNNDVITIIPDQVIRC